MLCSWLHLCLVFSLFSELLVKLAGERSLRPAPKCFPPLARLTNDIEKKAKESTIHNNNTTERTKYYQTTIMTMFTRKSNSTEEDETGFSSPYLCSRVVLNLEHPVQKEKFGACSVTGCWSFNGTFKIWALVMLNNSWWAVLYIELRQCHCDGFATFSLQWYQPLIAIKHVHQRKHKFECLSFPGSRRAFHAYQISLVEDLYIACPYQLQDGLVLKTYFFNVDVGEFSREHV